MLGAAQRYVAWLERRRRAILVATAAIVCTSIYLAVFHLPLHADLSDLLPQDVPAIRDLHRLEARLAAKDSIVAVVVASDPGERAAAMHELTEQARAIDPRLVTRIIADDAETRAFVRAHRHLYAPLAELESTEQALAARIADAKLKANPLYIDLDDAKPEDPHALDKLRVKRREAEARLDRSAYVSADARTQVIVIETAFRTTDIFGDRAVQNALDRIAADVRTRHPSATIGFGGGVASLHRGSPSALIGRSNSSRVETASAGSTPG